MEIQLKNDRYRNVFYFITNEVVNGELFFTFERVVWSEEKQDNVFESAETHNVLSFAQKLTEMKKVYGWEICS